MERRHDCKRKRRETTIGRRCLDRDLRWSRCKPLHHLSVSLQSSCSKDVLNDLWNSWTRCVCCSWWSLRHLIRRFWNQTLTCASVNLNAWAKYSLSGPTIYCWRANSPSSRSSCSAVKIVLTLFDFPPPGERKLELPFFVELSWPVKYIQKFLLEMISKYSLCSILTFLFIFFNVIEWS